MQNNSKLLFLFVSIFDPGDRKTKYYGPNGSCHSPNLPVLNYFLYAIYMYVLFPGIGLCHIFIEFICYVYVVVLSCILMTRHDHVAYLDLSELFPGPASLLSTYKGCVFFSCSIYVRFSLRFGLLKAHVVHLNSAF